MWYLLTPWLPLCKFLEIEQLIWTTGPRRRGNLLPVNQQLEIPVWNTGRSHFTSGLHSWKMSCKSSTKFPFNTVYFLAIDNLILYSVWLYHQWTFGPVENIYTHTHTHCICGMYIFLYNVFISNAIKMQETSIVFGMVHSATQTLQYFL